MPSTLSRAATKCISDVPGLVKQTFTSFSTSVLTRLSAPFIARSSISHTADVIARNGGPAKRASVRRSRALYPSLSLGLYSGGYAAHATPLRLHGRGDPPPASRRMPVGRRSRWRWIRLPAGVSDGPRQIGRAAWRERVCEYV